MSCWAVIPFKPPGLAKTRLAEALDSKDRAELARAMLGHVVAAARAAEGVDCIALLGGEQQGLPADLRRLDDPGTGLNAAVQAALAHVQASDARRFIVLFADLPGLSVQDVERLASATDGAIAIAPDRHLTGTNAISLPLPQAKGFTFAFGPDSFALHRAEAERIGLRLEQVDSPGLARDIDVPEDLPDAAGLIKVPE